MSGSSLLSFFSLSGCFKVKYSLISLDFLGISSDNYLTSFVSSTAISKTSGVFTIAFTSGDVLTVLLLSSSVINLSQVEFELLGKILLVEPLYFDSWGLPFDLRMRFPFQD